MDRKVVLLLVFLAGVSLSQRVRKLPVANMIPLL